MIQLSDTEQAYVDGLLKIANHDKVKQECEPHNTHAEVKPWMVVRVLRAQELLLSGLQKSEKK